MGWKVTLADKSMLVDDLPIDKVAKVADRHDMSWFELTTSSPAKNPAAFYALVAVVAETLGVPVPDPPVTVRETRKFLEVLDWADDDLPTEWVDGNPQEGETTTL